MSGSPSDAGGICERSRHVCACLCVSSTSTFCDCSVERMAWDIYGIRALLPCGWKLAVCKTDQDLFWATYRTEKWEHPFGPRRPLWSWVSGPELVGRACGTGRWRDTLPGPTGFCPARHRWQTSQCRLPSRHWRKPGHRPSLLRQRGEQHVVSSRCACVVCVAAKVSSLHLAVGHCSPRCNHPAAAAPAVQIFSLCSCTWRTCTDLPVTQGLRLIQQGPQLFLTKYTIAVVFCVNMNSIKCPQTQGESLLLHLSIWWPTCTRTKKRFFQRFQTFFPKAHKYLEKTRRKRKHQPIYFKWNIFCSLRWKH